MSCIERALPLLETNNGRYGHGHGHGPIQKYGYGLHHTGDRSYDVRVLRDSSRTEHLIIVYLSWMRL